MRAKFTVTLDPSCCGTRRSGFASTMHLQCSGIESTHQAAAQALGSGLRRRCCLAALCTGTPRHVPHRQRRRTPAQAAAADPWWRHA
jgi:hypothetical protein